MCSKSRMHGAMLRNRSELSSAPKLILPAFERVNLLSQGLMTISMGLLTSSAQLGWKGANGAQASCMMIPL